MPKKLSIPDSPIADLLSELGIGKNEAFLYAALLEVPSATVQELRQQTPFPRTLLYYLLKNLLQVGLVRTIESKKKTVYAAQSPEKIQDLLRQKEVEFNQRKQSLKNLIPELQNTFRLAHGRVGVRMLKGIEGYETLMQEIIETHPKTLYTVGVMSDQSRPGLAVRERLFDQLDKFNIVHKAAFVSSEESDLMIKQKKDTVEYTKLPSDFLDFEGELFIFAWSLATVRYTNRQPQVMIMQDTVLVPFIAQTLKYFWKQ